MSKFFAGIIIGIIIGAMSHEIDMRNEYSKDKQLTNTSWVTDWPTAQAKEGE
jgi:hypothetical protein